MTEPAQKRHGLRGNHFLPIVAGMLAFAAVCCALLLFAARPGTGQLLGYPGGRVSVPSKSASAKAAASSSISGQESYAAIESAAAAVSSGAAAATLSSYSQTSLQNRGWFDDAVLVGDSIIGGVSEYKVLPKSQVLYTGGMSAATATSVQVKSGGDSEPLLEALSDLKPKKVFLTLGFNDLDFTKSADTFASHYGTLLAKVQAACPDATLYVSSILPVTSRYAKRNSDSDNGRINDFNSELLTLCSDRHIRYLNAAALFRDSDGALPSSYSTDGYNLKAKYYYALLNYYYAQR